MKSVILTAMAAVFWAGAARADVFSCNPGDTCIAQSITGTILGGSDSGSTGTNDDANLFHIGGGPMFGDAITILVQYDVTAMRNNANGSASLTDGYGYVFEVPAAGSDFQITATLNEHGQSFVVDPAGSGSAAIVDVSGFNPNGVNSFEALAVGAAFQSQITVTNANPAYSYNDPGNAAEVSVIVADATDSTIFYGYSAQCNCDDQLVIGNAATTPEPAFWLPLVAGMFGMAVRRLRRGNHQPLRGRSARP